jgi:hypothetical protein
MRYWGVVFQRLGNRSPVINKVVPKTINHLTWVFSLMDLRRASVCFLIVSAYFM